MLLALSLIVSQAYSLNVKKDEDSDLIKRRYNGRMNKDMGLMNDLNGELTKRRYKDRFNILKRVQDASKLVNRFKPGKREPYDWLAYDYESNII